MADPETLLTGLVLGESARWHQERLWLANCDWDFAKRPGDNLATRSKRAPARADGPRARSRRGMAEPDR